MPWTWTGFRSSPARGYLLVALAEDGAPSALEFLSVCVRQSLDAELELAALRAWPAGAELDAVEHAWNFGASPEVRAAAEAVLRRERPQDPVWTAREVLGSR